MKGKEERERRKERRRTWMCKRHGCMQERIVYRTRVCTGKEHVQERSMSRKGACTGRSVCRKEVCRAGMCKRHGACIGLSG